MFYNDIQASWSLTPPKEAQKEHQVPAVPRQPMGTGCSRFRVEQVELFQTCLMFRDTLGSQLLGSQLVPVLRSSKRHFLVIYGSVFPVPAFCFLTQQTCFVHSSGGLVSFFFYHILYSAMFFMFPVQRASEEGEIAN